MRVIKVFMGFVMFLSIGQAFAEKENMLHLTNPDEIAAATLAYNKFQEASKATGACVAADRTKAVECICQNKALWEASEAQTQKMLAEYEVWGEDVMIDVQNGMSGFAFSAKAFQSAYNRVNGTVCH